MHCICTSLVVTHIHIMSSLAFNFSIDFDPSGGLFRQIHLVQYFTDESKFRIFEEKEVTLSDGELSKISASLQVNHQQMESC